ncbi:MAG: glucosidase, partial [Steroidobacteraceae bacterium]
MDTARTGADEEVASTPNAERERLRADASKRERWKEWGPYLSERQWGTVREDYSAGGTAWEYFPHDHARSRAYRWGEDGIAGLSDDEQRVCLSLALWNGRDSILKERLFGLTNSQGNHGEDVKEEYFYLDAAPSHSYLKMLYKYPQRAFPYADLVTENAARGTSQPEYELRDTGVFAGDRYFDVFVEYAQAQPGDILMQVTAWNRGPDAAPLHVIPQLVLRNTWTWHPGTVKPMLRAVGTGGVAIEPADLGMSHWYAAGAAELLFTENESNAPLLWNLGAPGYFKDGFDRRIVHAERAC